MTEFSKQELLRLVDKIPETDPTSTAYHVLMQSIECFNSLALTVDEIIALRDEQAREDLMEQRGLVKKQAEKIKEIAQDNVVPFTAAEFPAEVKEEIAQTASDIIIGDAMKALAAFDEKHPAPAPEPPKEEKTYAASDVRKALVEVKAKGVDVKEVLSEFGVTDFRALPAAKYGALMQRLEAM